MIDQFSDDGTGWARFGDEFGPDGEPVMRYHLARSVSDRARADADCLSSLAGLVIGDSCAYDITAFLLCNPSDATAFKPDPTVTECVKFTRRWGSDITWVVNLWALRSPYPADLRKRAAGSRGDDEVNNRAILTACRLATRVIGAWGLNGALDHRAKIVCKMLDENGIRLDCIGLTQDGSPKHPLARGVHRIPADQQPVPWRMP